MEGSTEAFTEGVDRVRGDHRAGGDVELLQPREVCEGAQAVVPQCEAVRYAKVLQGPQRSHGLYSGAGEAAPGDVQELESGERGEWD